MVGHVRYSHPEDAEEQQLLSTTPSPPSRSPAVLKVVVGLFVVSAVVAMVAEVAMPNKAKAMTSASVDALVTEAEEAKVQCSKSGEKKEGCLKTHCCEDRSHTCFEKNDRWADCKKSCKSGTFDPNSPVEFRSNWTCKVLTTGPCAATGTDCLNSRCCAEPGHFCYRKSPFYGGCRPNCTAGEKFDEDPDDKKIPWTCELLDVNASNGTNSSNATATTPPPTLPEGAE